MNGFPTDPWPAGATAPRVVVWQRVHCAVMAALYGLLAATGGAMAIFSNQLADDEATPADLLFGGLLLAIGCLLLAAVYGAGIILPRRRWAWIYHLVLIAIGMTSCACLPFCVPLLVFWIRPETQAWFAETALDGPLGRPVG